MDIQCPTTYGTYGSVDQGASHTCSVLLEVSVSKPRLHGCAVKDARVAILAPFCFLDSHPLPWSIAVVHLRNKTERRRKMKGQPCTTRATGDRTTPGELHEQINILCLNVGTPVLVPVTAVKCIVTISNHNYSRLLEPCDAKPTLP